MQRYTSECDGRSPPAIRHLIAGGRDRIPLSGQVIRQLLGYPP